jgi:predicted  nucleic acid-binding Zn-ribbon protein
MEISRLSTVSSKQEKSIKSTEELDQLRKQVLEFKENEERLEAEVKFLLEQIEKVKQTPMITEQSEIKRMAARHQKEVLKL